MLQITKSNNVFEVFTRKSVDFGEGGIILVNGRFGRQIESKARVKRIFSSD